MWNVELNPDPITDFAAETAPPVAARAQGRKQVGQILVARGIVSEEQIELAIEEQTRRKHRQLLGEVLVEMGMASEDQVIEALAEAYNVPYAKLSPRLAAPKAGQIRPRGFRE